MPLKRITERTASVLSPNTSKVKELPSFTAAEWANVAITGIDYLSKRDPGSGSSDCFLCLMYKIAHKLEGSDRHRFLWLKLFILACQGA